MFNGAAFALAMPKIGNLTKWHTMNNDIFKTMPCTQSKKLDILSLAL